MSDIKGTNVASMVAPFTTGDKYATHDAKYGKGGYRSANTILERNSIPYQRRDLNMLVYVSEDDTIYKLVNNPEADTTSNTDWLNILSAITWNEI